MTNVTPITTLAEVDSWIADTIEGGAAACVRGTLAAGVDAREATAKWLDAFERHEDRLTRLVEIHVDGAEPFAMRRLHALAAANRFDHPIVRYYVRRAIWGPSDLRTIALDEGPHTHRFATDEMVELIVTSLLELAPASAAPCVQTITITGNGKFVSREAVTSLSRWIADPAAWRVRRLDLSSNEISSEGVAALVLALETGGPACTLEALAINNVGMSAQGGELLACALGGSKRALPIAPRLEWLEVEHNQLPSTTCRSIALAARSHPRLSCLKLITGNQCDPGNEELRELLSLPTLEASLASDVVATIRALCRDDESVISVTVGAGGIAPSPGNYKLITRALEGNTSVTSLHIDDSCGHSALALLEAALRTTQVSAITLRTFTMSVASAVAAVDALHDAATKSDAVASRITSLTMEVDPSADLRALPPALRHLIVQCPSLTTLAVLPTATAPAQPSHAATIRLLELAAAYRYDPVVGPHTNALALHPAANATPDVVTFHLLGTALSSASAFAALAHIYRRLVPRAVSGAIRHAVIHCAHTRGKGSVADLSVPADSHGASASRIALDALFDLLGDDGSFTSLDNVSVQGAYGDAETEPTAQPQPTTCDELCRRLEELLVARRRITALHFDVVGTDDRPPPPRCEQWRARLERLRGLNAGRPVFRQLALILMRPSPDSSLSSRGLSDDATADIDARMVHCLFDDFWSVEAAQCVVDIDLSHVDAGTAGFDAAIRALQAFPNRLRRLKVRNANIVFTAALAS
jgi:hypothetical protein